MIKYKPQGIIFEKNEKNNKTTSVTGYAMMHNVSFKILTSSWSDFLPVAVGL